MTKLRYLKARNPKRLLYRDMPGPVKVLLDACVNPDKLDVFYDRTNEWGPRVSPGCSCFPDTAYRVSKTDRPDGIPDDIHGKYDS